MYKKENRFSAVFRFEHLYFDISILFEICFLQFVISATAV